jgi:hypothetical protein
MCQAYGIHYILNTAKIICNTKLNIEVHQRTVRLGYNVMKGTEYFVSL